MDDDKAPTGDDGTFEDLFVEGSELSPEEATEIEQEREQEQEQEIGKEEGRGAVGRVTPPEVSDKERGEHE